MDFIDELERKSKEVNGLQSAVLDIDMLEPLIDLGYLTFDEIKPENPEQFANLERAIRQFRKDCSDYRLLQHKFTFIPFEQEHFHRYKRRLSEVEMTFLQSLVSFEDSLVFSKLPNIGTVSIFTRVLHYRLKMLGLYGKKAIQGIESPFDNAALDDLHSIIGFLKLEISDLEFVNQIGNIDSLIDLIYNKVSEGEVGKKMIYMDAEGRFLTNIIGIQPERSVALYYEFLARIFQIRIWVDGLYNGEIDGIIKNDDKNGYSTIKAIEELVDYLRKDKELREDDFIKEKGYNLKKLDVKDFYHQKEVLGKPYVLNVIDLLKITKSMKGEESVAAVSDILIDDGNRRLRKKLFEEDGQLKEDFRNELLAREQDFLSGKRRRLYYGFKQFGRVIKRVVRSVIERIKLGFNFFRRLAVTVFREIKSGIKVFLHGMKFLVGKREIVTSLKSEVGVQSNDLSRAIISKYDLDFDSIVFVSNQCDEEAKARHTEKCTIQMNSLKISLKVTAQVLRWALILSTGTISWTQLLLMASRTVREMNVIDFSRNAISSQ